MSTSKNSNTKKCLICENEINPFISYGQMPIANGFLNLENISKEFFFHMQVAHCNNCNMVQLLETPERELMFNENYAFFSGTSQVMKEHFKNFALDIKNNYLDVDDPFVVEIGSNDGTLLEFVKNRGIRHLGIDPSPNVVASSLKKGVSAEVGFFGKEFGRDVKIRHGKADYIFAANVICHIPDINDFAQGIRELLNDKGQFVFEEPYIGSVLSKTSYDQIYDEHVFIFGALSVQNIFSRAGLELVDAIPQSTHGGSMRYVIMHENQREISEGAQAILQS